MGGNKFFVDEWGGERGKKSKITDSKRIMTKLLGKFKNY